jgi:hypothetical protein
MLDMPAAAVNVAFSTKVNIPSHKDNKNQIERVDAKTTRCEAACCGGH